MPDESIWEESESERELRERLEASVEQLVQANDGEPDAAPDTPPSLPVEAPDDETPPDSAVPAFLVQPNKFPGASQPDGVYLPDGTPVGQWLHRDHRHLDGQQVEKLLLDMGLDAANAAHYGRQREQMRRSQVGLSPGMQGLANAEARHEEQTRAVREAFIAAQKKKQ